MKTNEKKFPVILQSILDALEITSYRMAVDMGYATSKITGLLNGGNPTRDFLEEMMRCYPQLNPDFVLSQIGPVFRNGNARPIGIMSDMEFVEVPFFIN